MVQLRAEKCAKRLTKFMPSLLGIQGPFLLATRHWFEQILVQDVYNESKNKTMSIMAPIPSKLPILSTTSISLSLIDFIHIPTIITGPGQLAHYSCCGGCSSLQPATMMRFRSWLIHNVFYGSPTSTNNTTTTSSNGNDNDETLRQKQRQEENLQLTNYWTNRSPDPGQITIVLPIGSSHSNCVMQFQNSILPALQEQFETIQYYNSTRRNTPNTTTIPSMIDVPFPVTITAVDMATLSMQEQVQLMILTKVLLDNMGGGSLTSIFLPQGSTLLLWQYDYTSNWPKSEKMDKSIYDSFSHFQIHWMKDNDLIDTIMNHILYALLS